MTAPTQSKNAGPAIKTFQDRAVRGIDYFLWIIPGLLLTLSFTVYGGYLVVLGSTREITAEGQFWLIAAGLIFIPFAVLWIRAISRSRRVITIHENGVRLVRITKKPRFLPWDYIESFRTFGTRYHLFGITFSDRYTLEIGLKRGEIIPITGRFKEFDSLVSMLQTNFDDRFNTLFRGRWESGETIAFGPVVINVEGLQVKQASISWAELENVQVNAGILVIKSTSRKFKIPVREVPNIRQLLHILSNRAQSWNSSEEKV